MKWLVTTDPSPNHNAACQLHEPHTGKWLTNSPEYKSWKDASTQFLWIHGIPGAGKTVLLSYIFEDVTSFCEGGAPEGTGCAYYYCYFGRGQDETTHLLRWVISRVCRQINGLPVEVKELFRQGTQPRAAKLLDVLAGILQNLPRVYLAIDALDKSANRESILESLYSILQDERLKRLQILITSRKELDIESALSPLGEALSLSNPHVDNDIRTYIQSRLRKDRKFSRWSNQLKSEIESGLVAGAKGM